MSYNFTKSLFKSNKDKLQTDKHSTKKSDLMKAHDLEVSSSNNTIIHYEEPIEKSAVANQVKSFDPLIM